MCFIDTILWIVWFLWLIHCEILCYGNTTTPKFYESPRFEFYISFSYILVCLYQFCNFDFPQECFVVFLFSCSISLCFWTTQNILCTSWNNQIFVRQVLIVSYSASPRYNPLKTGLSKIHFVSLGTQVTISFSTFLSINI